MDVCLLQLLRCCSCIQCKLLSQSSGDQRRAERSQVSVATATPQAGETSSYRFHQRSCGLFSRDGKSITGDGCLSMRLECWSCSPVRRKGCRREEEAAPGLAPRRCAHACCAYACGAQLTPDPAGWGENSDSGQGTFSQRTTRCTTELEASRTNPSLEDGETDPEDTSAFDYSSVTSCSPDGTLRREVEESISGEYEEEDSQVPVLLKPSGCQPQAKEAPREKTVCLRWQIPRQTPHPPLRNPTGPPLDGPAPCLLSSFGKRLVSVRKGSPPLHPKSAFRPIWDDPTKQV